MHNFVRSSGNFGDDIVHMSIFHSQAFIHHPQCGAAISGNSLIRAMAKIHDGGLHVRWVVKAWIIRIDEGGKRGRFPRPSIHFIPRQFTSVHLLPTTFEFLNQPGAHAVTE